MESVDNGVESISRPTFEEVENVPEGVESIANGVESISRPTFEEVENIAEGVESIVSGVESILRPTFEEVENAATGVESTIGSVESISRPTFEDNQVAGNEPGLRRSCRGSHPTRYYAEEFNVLAALAEDDEELNEYMETYSESDLAVTDTDTDEDLPGFAESETEDDEHDSSDDEDWEPHYSSESSDSEVPQELQHLMEAGYTAEEIMQLAQQVDTWESLALDCEESMSVLSSSVEILLDGGTFDHMLGKGVCHLVTNRNKVEPVPVATAGCIRSLDEKGDLTIGDYTFTGGYLNPHMDTTLISEGIESQENKWKFYSSDEGKVS